MSLHPAWSYLVFAAPMWGHWYLLRVFLNVRHRFFAIVVTRLAAKTLVHHLKSGIKLDMKLERGGGESSGKGQHKSNSPWMPKPRSLSLLGLQELKSLGSFCVPALKSLAPVGVGWSMTNDQCVGESAGNLNVYLRVFSA
jgi:hypothetical protein